MRKRETPVAPTWGFCLYNHRVGMLYTSLGKFHRRGTDGGMGCLGFWLLMGSLNMILEVLLAAFPSCIKGQGNKQKTESGLLPALTSRQWRLSCHNWDARSGNRRQSRAACVERLCRGGRIIGKSRHGEGEVVSLYALKRNRYSGIKIEKPFKNKQTSPQTRFSLHLHPSLFLSIAISISLCVDETKSRH